MAADPDTCPHTERADITTAADPMVHELCNSCSAEIVTSRPKPTGLIGADQSDDLDRYAEQQMPTPNGQAAISDAAYAEPCRAWLQAGGTVIEEGSIEWGVAFDDVIGHPKFRAAVDAARAQRTAEIVAALRDYGTALSDGDIEWLSTIADMIERGEIG